MLVKFLYQCCFCFTLLSRLKYLKRIFKGRKASRSLISTVLLILHHLPVFVITHWILPYQLLCQLLQFYSSAKLSSLALLQTYAVFSIKVFSINKVLELVAKLWDAGIKAHCQQDLFCFGNCHRKSAAYRTCLHLNSHHPSLEWHKLNRRHCLFTVGHFSFSNLMKCNSYYFFQITSHAQHCKPRYCKTHSFPLGGTYSCDRPYALKHCSHISLDQLKALLSI